jgi:hypothetical protein
MKVTPASSAAWKGGITRTAEKDFGRDGSLAYLRSAVLRSQENLGVDVIDLYAQHLARDGDLLDAGVGDADRADEPLVLQRLEVLHDLAVDRAERVLPPGIREATGNCATATSTASRSCRGVRWAALA